MLTIVAAGDRGHMQARKSVLTEAGFRVIEADSIDAIRRAIAPPEQSPALVLLDARLPAISVAGMAALLRGEPVRVPILIVFQPLADPAEIASALDYADAYLVEPVPPVVLVASVRALARNAGAAVAASAVDATRELEHAHRRLAALMKAVPVGVSFSDDPTCERITGNPAALAQFEVTELDNLSASAPDPAAPGRRGQFFHDGRPLTDADLPLQRAVAERREIAPMELEVHLPNGRIWYAEASGAPVLDTQGKLTGGVAVCVDITERKRAENQVRDLLQRLTYHVDNSPLAVIEWGADLRLVRWSGTAERVFGWKAEEVLGKRMEDFAWIYEEDLTRVTEISEDLKTGRNPLRFSANRNYRKDGQVVHCEWYNSALLDEAGRLRSILSLVLDVTERKQAENALRESRDWLALAQRIAKSGSFDVDLASNTVVWSDELKALYGIDSGYPQIRIEEWLEWVAPEDRDRVLAAMTRGIDEGEVVTQFRIRRRDTGELRWVEGRGRTLRNERGAPARMVGFSIDITDQKRAEEEVHRAAERYKRSNEQLQQFSFAVSHDLQEPLRNVVAFTELLERRWQGPIDPETANLFAILKGGALRMRALISDLLAYSRVELEEHETATVDMQATLYFALANLKQSIDSARAEVTFERLPAVVGNYGRLAQLLQNLIGNALKYRREETPRVHVSVEQQGDFHRFSVRDNGIGIDPAYHDRIFGIFRRLHSADEYPGTGIGLAICKKIVERHGGSIWVDSKPGSGSTFFFTLRSAEGQSSSASSD